jgi:hypothetical protein
MRHEMLTQRNPFCHHVNAKKGTLSQHFVTHVVPPLSAECLLAYCDLHAALGGPILLCGVQFAYTLQLVA